MNALTDAGVLVEDKLFATLDTRTRRWQFRGGGRVLLSRHGRLHPRPAAPPGRLVQGHARRGPPGRPAAARRRRLSPEAEEQIQAVKAVLEELGLRRQADAPGAEQGRPRPRPLVPRRAAGPTTTTRSPSAPASGEGLDRLEQAVREALHERALDAEVETGVENGRVLAYLAQHAQIHDRTYDDDRVLLQCRLPRRCLDFLSEHGADVRANGQRIYA